MFRGQRSKLLQQQKEKFRHKYSNFTSDIKPSKDDSLRLDSLISPTKIYLNKTKAPDEVKRALVYDRKITLSNDQQKSKTLKSKEKVLQIQPNSIFMNAIDLNTNLILLPEQSKPDFFGVSNKLNMNDHESEDIKRGYTSDFYRGRRSEVIRSNQNNSLGNNNSNLIHAIYLYRKS